MNDTLAARRNRRAKSEIAEIQGTVPYLGLLIILFLVIFLV